MDCSNFNWIKIMVMIQASFFRRSKTILAFWSQHLYVYNKQTNRDTEAKYYIWLWAQCPKSKLLFLISFESIKFLYFLLIRQHFLYYSFRAMFVTANRLPDWEPIDLLLIQQNHSVSKNRTQSLRQIPKIFGFSWQLLVLKLTNGNGNCFAVTKMSLNW